MDDFRALVHLRARLENGLREIADDAVIFGENVERVANTTCFSLPGVSAETAVIALDLEGIAVSSGSACSSGKIAKSHVLEAMGVEDDLIKGAIRVSTGWYTEENHIDTLLEKLEMIIKRTRG
jgi:cysteine desulfurase